MPVMAHHEGRLLPSDWHGGPAGQEGAAPWPARFGIASGAAGGHPRQPRRWRVGQPTRAPSTAPEQRRLTLSAMQASKFWGAASSSEEESDKEASSTSSSSSGGCCARGKRGRRGGATPAAAAAPAWGAAAGFWQRAV